MPRVAIPVAQPTRAGLTPPAEINGDPVNDHSLSNNGRTILIARNNGAGSQDVQVQLNPSSIDGQAIPPKTISVPAAATRWIGPFPTEVYGSTVNIDVTSADLRFQALTVR